jgi:hypothetical protein
MSSNTIFRVITGIILVLLTFIAPWWLVMILAAGACFYFFHYFEIVGLGLIIDSLYNAPIRDLGHIQVFCALLGLVVLIAAEEVRERTRFGTR